MRLKVKCPDCGRTHLLRAVHTRKFMACPTCGCDFVPARDAVLSCPKCGMIIAAPHDFDKGRLSCIGCGFVVPGMRLAWLRREMKWVFGAGLIIATVLLQACQG